MLGLTPDRDQAVAAARCSSNAPAPTVTRPWPGGLRTVIAALLRRAAHAQVPAMLACALLLTGCKGGTSVGARPSSAGPTAASHDTLNAAQIAQQGGVCDVNRDVVNPEPDTPEWVIWRAFQLAQQPDDEATFNDFVGLFPAGKDPRQLREFLWTHLRKNVGKFVLTPGSGDFNICRTMAKTDGTQYYIRSSSASSAPPMGVGRVDGAWKFTFLTPF